MIRTRCCGCSASAASSSASGEPMRNSPAGIRTSSSFTPLPRSTANSFGATVIRKLVASFCPSKPVADTVTFSVPAAWSGGGVQENSPDCGSILAPRGAPAARLYRKLPFQRWASSTDAATASAFPRR